MKDADIPVVPIPGPTALVTALSASGLPMHEFTFLGFLPHKKGKQTRLKQLSEEEKTVVCYESPHRLLKTLEMMIPYFGADRRCSVSRELSKIYQETKNVYL